MTGDGKVVEFTAALRSEVEKAQMAMGNNGLRVLGFCTKTLPIKQYGKAYPWSDGRDLGKSTANFPLGESKAIASYKAGILWSPTARKIEEMNAAEGLQPGDVGYQDPALAQAIVVPGWEISDDDPVEKWDAIS